MANLFKNPNWISMEVLRLLVNKKQVCESFNTDWEKDFTKSFAPGSSIQVKFPQRFTIRNGLGYSPQGIDRITTTVNLDQVFGVDFEWTDYEAAVNLERSEEEIRRQYLEPAADQLAQEADSRAAQFAYQNCSNVTGALGTDPTTSQPFLDADAILFNAACPEGDRYMITSSSVQKTLVPQLQTIFNPASEIAQQYKRGVMGTAFGWEWYRSNSLWSHTAGTWAAAVTVNGAGQSGSTLAITATAGDTFKVGDKISIDSVNAVNPVTRRIAGSKTPKTFTITQAYTATGANDSIQIYPAINGPGSQYQNVDALPANTAALTLWPGTTSPNGKAGTISLGLTKYAFAMVSGKLEAPKESSVQVLSEATDPETGISIRFVRAWDPVQSRMINRFDVMLGFGVLYGDAGAVCIAGA